MRSNDPCPTRAVRPRPDLASGLQPAAAPSSAVRSLSSISHAWSSVWKAEWRMRKGSVHDSHGLLELAGVVGAHRRDVVLSILPSCVQGNRPALRDPQSDPRREVLALDADGVADDPVAVASAPARALAHHRRHARRDAVEERPARAQERDRALELGLAQRPVLGRRRREGDAPEVGPTGTDLVLDDLEGSGGIEFACHPCQIGDRPIALPIRLERLQGELGGLGAPTPARPVEAEGDRAFLLGPVFDDRADRHDLSISRIRRSSGLAFSDGYTYTPTYGQSSSQEIRCQRAEQDDLRLAGRPRSLPAGAGARRRQPVRRDLRCAQSLRRHRGREARGLRRDQGPRRVRQGPQGPIHRAPPGRVGELQQQRLRALPRLARPDRQVRRPRRAQRRLHDGRPGRQERRLARVSRHRQPQLRKQRRPGQPRSRRVRSRSFANASRRSSTTWSPALPKSRMSKTSTSDPRPVSGRGGER